MIDKKETKEQIETTEEVSKYAKEYIINWINNNMPKEEANKLIKTIL